MALVTNSNSVNADTPPPPRHSSVGYRGKSLYLLDPKGTRHQTVGRRTPLDTSAQLIGDVAARLHSNTDEASPSSSDSEKPQHPQQRAHTVGRLIHAISFRGNRQRTGSTPALPVLEINGSSFELPKKGQIIISFSQGRNRSGRSASSVESINYKNIQLLGSGGTSKVYEVKIKNHAKVISVNLTPAGFFQDDELQKMITPYHKIYQDFLRYLPDQLVKVEAMGGIIDNPDDPHSLRLAFVMEKLTPLTSEPTKWAEALMEICEIMNEECLLHRDIKPDNLMLRDGELVLIDFLDGGTTKEHLEEITSIHDLRRHIGDRLAVSQLYSHPDYHSRSQEFNTTRLFTVEEANNLIEEYVTRELANQEVQFAITIWSLFLGAVPSKEGSKFPDLDTMIEKWNTVTCSDSIRNFVSTKLSQPSAGV